MQWTGIYSRLHIADLVCLGKSGLVAYYLALDSLRANWAVAADQISTAMKNYIVSTAYQRPNNVLKSGETWPDGYPQQAAVPAIYNQAPLGYVAVFFSHLPKSGW